MRRPAMRDASFSCLTVCSGYQARELFKTPEATPGESVDLVWGECDEEGLKKFLVEQKGFNPDRVTRGIEKLKKAKGTFLAGQVAACVVFNNSSADGCLQARLRSSAWIPFLRSRPRHRVL